MTEIKKAPAATGAKKNYHITSLSRLGGNDQ